MIRLRIDNQPVPKWFIVAAILVSIIRMDSFFSSYLVSLKNFNAEGIATQTSASQPVIYENFTTPNFKVKIGYKWEDGPRTKTRKKAEVVANRSQEESNQANTNIMEGTEEKRLVVDVNENYVFWNGAQERLCDLLRNMTNRTNLGVSQESNDQGVSKAPTPLLNVTIDCLELSKNQDFGQGNWITALYCVRIAAAKARVDYQFQCTDGRESETSLMLPWFEGYYAAPTEDNPWPYDGDIPSEREACSSRYPLIRVDTMAHAIQKDIQKMAVRLVGARTDFPTSKKIRDEADFPAEPLVPNITLDDVAIHFRCGDIMGQARRHDFGLIKYTEYPKWINNETRRIGILTQPFDKAHNRQRDSGKTEACREAVMLLVKYLQEHFPSAVISIHNGPQETLPLAYARLAMAKQSFTSLSSFGIFPVVGTFGMGYFQKGNRGVNPFAHRIPQYLSNIHEMNAPVLTSGKIGDIGLNATLEWFVSDDSMKNW